MIDIFAKRYGWSVEYILSLTRRQIRLLSVSAGDHERLPKTDKDGEKDDETINLLKSDKEEDVKMKEKLLKKLRKGVAQPGKFATLGDKKEVKIKKIDKLIHSKHIDKSLKEFLEATKSESVGIKIK